MTDAVTTIRPEASGDRAAVHALNAAAFETRAEADLVDRLREQAEGYIGLVAEQGGEIVGHIAFSPVTLAPAHPHLDVRGLAPMAVAPGRQRQGVGSALVRAGLDACQASGADAVVVLGHPAYYPRFGFASGALACAYDVPPEAFMALALTPGALKGVAATAHYHPTFGEL